MEENRLKKGGNKGNADGGRKKQLIVVQNRERKALRIVFSRAPKTAISDC